MADGPDSRERADAIQIADEPALAGTPARETALACLRAGIAAALPGRVVPRRVELDGDRLTITAVSPDEGRERSKSYDLAGREIIVLGGGKAAARVARELEAILGDRIDHGAVVTDDPVSLDRIEVIEASHPVPDERGVTGAERVLELARGADADALALVVLTGGGSALLPAPVPGIDLAALQSVTADLLAAGAPIEDLNAVRKHCSRLKGGRLAVALAPAAVVTLAISDVVGDDPAVIASGPTVGDPTTYGDALSVLERYGIEAPAVRDHLKRAAAGDHAVASGSGDRGETPTPGDPAVVGVDYHLLATGDTAIEAARETATERGYTPLVLSARIRGEAREAGRTHAAIAEAIRQQGAPVAPPAVVISGGETTVTVRGDGHGGPNAEFSLAGALDLATAPGITVGEEIAVAAVDTDGRDGPPREAEEGTKTSDGVPALGTPAGAILDAPTVPVEQARRALADSDAHGVCRGRGAIHTGATGTNVNDLRVLVVEADEDDRRT